MGRKSKIKSNRADGRYGLSFRYEGKTYSITGRDYEDALRKKDKRLKELEAGAAKRINPTMQEYFEIFIKRATGDGNRRTVKGATILLYKTAWNKLSSIRVRGNLTFGEMHLRKVTFTDMDIVQEKLAKDLVSTTANRYMAFASQLFNDAINRGIRETANPCNALTMLARTEATPQETCHRALSVEESKRFFEAAEDSFYKELFIVLSETGMRIGEVSALTIDDVDFDRMELHVTKTVTRSKDNKVEIGDSPKTEAGYRIVPITARCEAALMDQIKKNRMIFGNSDLVFRTVRGCVITTGSVRYDITSICKVADLEPISPHALRALFATRFREQFPENPFVLKALLGHSENDVTSLYAAVTTSTLHRYMSGFNLFYDPELLSNCKAKILKAV